MTPSSFDRRRFLESLALLVAAAGTAGTSGCSSDDPTGPGGGATADGFFSFADFPALASPGGAADGRVDGHSRVFVRRVSATEVLARSMTCTHQGCTVARNAASLDCPCHGSRFDLSGNVTRGPAARSLGSIPATLEADGIQVG